MYVKSVLHAITSTSTYGTRGTWKCKVPRTYTYMYVPRTVHFTFHGSLATYIHMYVRSIIRSTCIHRL